MNLDLRKLRSHPVWFFLGCMVAGVAVSRLPYLVEPNGNVAVLPFLGTWVLTGLLAGMLVPDRPWRWGVAMVLPLPLLSVILNPNHREALGMALVTLPLLPIMATPIIAGAYIGRALIGHRHSPPVPESSGPSTASQLVLVFSTYVVCCVPLVFLSFKGLLPFWAAAAVLFSLLSILRFRLRPLRSTALAVTIVVGAFMTSVIYDSVSHGPDHHLLPFELWAVLTVAAVASGTSASLTSLAQKRAQQ